MKKEEANSSPYVIIVSIATFSAIVTFANTTLAGNHTNGKNEQRSFHFAGVSNILREQRWNNTMIPDAVGFSVDPSRSCYGRKLSAKHCELPSYGYIDDCSSAAAVASIIRDFNGSKDAEEVIPDRHAFSDSVFNLKEFLSAFPSMDESIPIRSSNDLCARHSRFILKEANHMHLWALRMLDSGGKVPSGLLSGNINQLGDFDECLSVKGIYNDDGENDSRMSRGKSHPLIESPPVISGKYCLASIDLTLPPSLSSINNLLHSHYVINSKLSDPGHRIPKFASVYWAVCVPHSCRGKDVKEMLDYQLQKVQVPGLSKNVSVEEFMCQSTVDESRKISLATCLAVLFFTSIIVITIIATVKDFNKTDINEGNPSEFPMNLKNKAKRIILESFSLKKNVKILLNTNGSADDVACLHGIRALNAIALLLSHKCMQLLFYSYVNRTQMTETISYPWSMLARSAIVYTDSFILISGCLAAQSFLKNFDRKNTNIANSYITRFLRLTPNLLAIIVFCTYILPFLHAGPMWNVVVSGHADLCKKYWWRNLLYVHNYFGFEEMCLTHTHQLGIDMQLYLTSPLLIYLLWKFPVFGVLVSITLATISTYLRYYVTLKNNLSPIIYYGVSVSQLFNTATLSYILPTHRATVYIIGILLGYYLHYKSAIPLKLTKNQINFGTYFFTCCGFFTMFGPYWMSDRHYKYNSAQAATYMAFSSIIWSLALVWGIIINVQNYTGFIGSLFRWSGFRIFTRIAYAVYLIQFPVYFFNVGSTRAPNYFTFKVMLNVEEYLTIFLLSVLLTLLFDLPFQNISRSIPFGQSKKSSRNVPSVNGKLRQEISNKTN